MQIGKACDPADSLQKANQFNEFFCIISKELAEASSNHPIKYSMYLRKSVSYSTYLESSTTYEVINCIDSFNVNKAVGHDNIPAYFLKIAAPTLAPYLRFVLISSLLMESFPTLVKLPKLFPFIKREKRITNNFRPISILNCFSKILEKTIH